MEKQVKDKHKEDDRENVYNLENIIQLDIFTNQNDQKSFLKLVRLKTQALPRQP